VARNAHRLLDDAEVLLAGNRWPGAQALAALACEEFGKAGGALVLSIVPAEHRRRANPTADELASGLTRANRLVT
jgi:AbiV family abortive infection protein